ncbi:MAG: hypothetical protein NUK65_07650 [Firmicutes bacterium]|nr:hypothetical protein [Bacillota bacterium]
MKVPNTPGSGKCIAKVKRVHREVECEGWWPQRVSAEHNEYAGALTDSGITENNINNADRPEDGLREEILLLIHN